MQRSRADLGWQGVQRRWQYLARVPVEGLRPPLLPHRPLPPLHRPKQPKQLLRLLPPRTPRSLPSPASVRRPIACG